MVRVAVIDYDRCKPSKCNLECIRFCPIVRSGAKAVEIDGEKKKPVINEVLCVGCGICVKKCPFKTISVVNLPEELEESAVYRYGANAFKLYRLPIVKEGVVTGIVGRNGTGKTTALKILAGEIMPNLGRWDAKVDWDEIIRFFRGSELQGYFKKLSEKTIRVAHKIQYVDLVPKYVKGRVGELLRKADERGVVDMLKEELGLASVWDRELKFLSGGELQRFLVAAVLSKDVDVYLFDEPCSYLDVHERVKVAKIIRRHTAERGKICIVVEHDLAILDYLSDLIHVIYGIPGVYGIVSHPYSVREGINNFLEGFLPDENMKIRDEPVKFTVKPPSERWSSERVIVEWSKIRKSLDGFSLEVEPGKIHEGEVIGILGPNGIGKTTFVRLLAGELEVDEGAIYPYGRELRLSYKPQYLSSYFRGGLVREVLEDANPEVLKASTWLHNELVAKMGLDKLLDRDVLSLSGGELQKTAISATLAREADLYLLDEPSAYLDVDERLRVASLVRKIVESRKAAAFIVEHDIIIQDFISTTIMPFLGEPGVRGYARAPSDLKSGMNTFLKSLEITFRRDPKTKRPRVNKEGSYLDRFQKERGEYYYLES